MTMEGFFILVIEPLLWSLVVFFSLLTIIDTFNNTAPKARKYAIITSILVFLLVASDDLMRSVIW